MKEHFYLWNRRIKILSTPIITIFSGFSKNNECPSLKRRNQYYKLTASEVSLLLVEAEFYLSL